MAKKVVWSEAAKRTYFAILSYLEEKWTRKEIGRFVDKTYATIGLIANNSVQFRRSGKRKNIFEVKVTKHNLLIYKVDGEVITLLMFFDTRQHPRKKKY